MLSLLEILNEIPDGGAVAFVKVKYEREWRVLYSQGDRGTAANVTEVEVHATKGRIMAEVLDHLKESVSRKSSDDEFERI
jgi:hypothetical protein